MPTPNSPLNETVDIHADPQFRGQYGARGGERDLEKANVSEVLAPPRARPCNVGRTEQQVRLVAGGLMLGAAVFAPIGRAARIGLAVFGVAEIITGAMRYCPLWQATGIDTNNVRGLR